jgi:hypothetical protein
MSVQDACFLDWQPRIIVGVPLAQPGQRASPRRPVAGRAPLFWVDRQAKLTLLG